MGIITWIIFGLIAGIIAKLIMPGRDPGGFIVTTLLGIVGAVIGGWIGSTLGFGSVNTFDLRSLFVAVIGAIVLLLIYRMVRGRSTRA
jgi:uncharacterized membrane protein YeaQ/YmgE (transglycosylase-associated protein family)